MPKFGRIYDTLLRDGIAVPGQFSCATPAPRAWLERIHTCDYVSATLQGQLDDRSMRRIGFPWSPQLVHRTCTAVGGTVLTAQLALAHGMACNTAGGTHHAFADHGSGFCIFNDLAIAARCVQDQGLARRVLILDLDVHQGDGTAAILRDDPTVFTFSIHCAQNFPFQKQQSDLDVALEEGTDDDGYLDRLADYLAPALTLSDPDLVIYDAGVDPHRDDQLGKLALTDAGLHRRDQMVLESCLSRAIPVACVVGGGYSSDIDALARRHTLLHQVATECFQKYRL